MEADGRTPAASVSYRDVTKRYPGQSSPAINHLSLEIPAGDICVLVAGEPPSSNVCRLDVWLYCRAS